MHKAKLALSQLVISQLIILDMQEKLASAMPADAMQQVTKNCGILAQAAVLLNVPTVLTEQYPQGLGATLPEIKLYLPAVRAIAKTAFSACTEPKFNQQLQRENSHIILVGMESHICVLQTALDLIEAGKTVFVVEDAILSRTPANKTNALARLQQAGAVITNTESVLFEWLGNANHEAFKALSKLIR
jgi:nicotinamidase-related amidase